MPKIPNKNEVDSKDLQNKITGEENQPAVPETPAEPAVPETPAEPAAPTEPETPADPGNPETDEQVDPITALNGLPSGGSGDGSTTTDHFNQDGADKKTDASGEKKESSRARTKLNENSTQFRNNAIRSADSVISKAKGTTLINLKEKLSESASVIGMISGKAAYNDIVLEKKKASDGTEEYSYNIISKKPSNPKAIAVKYNATLKRKQTEYERTTDKLNAEIKDFGAEQIETEWFNQAQLLEFCLNTANGYVRIDEALFRPIISTRTDNTTKQVVIQENTTMKSYGENKEWLSPCGGKPGFFVKSKWGVSKNTADKYAKSNRTLKELNQNVDLWYRTGSSAREYTELRHKLYYTGSRAGVASPVGARLDGDRIVWNTIPVSVPEMRTITEALNPVNQEQYKDTALVDQDRAKKHVTFAYFGRFLATSSKDKQPVDKESKLAKVIAADKSQVFNISSTGDALATSPLVGEANAAAALAWANKLTVKHASLKNPENGTPIRLTPDGKGDLELKVIERTCKIKSKDIAKQVRDLHTKEDILGSAKSVPTWRDLDDKYIDEHPYVRDLMSIAEMTTPQDVIVNFRKAATTSHSGKASSASIELTFVGERAATLKSEEDAWYNSMSKY